MADGRTPDLKTPLRHPEYILYAPHRTIYYRCLLVGDINYLMLATRESTLNFMLIMLLLNL